MLQYTSNGESHEFVEGIGYNDFMSAQYIPKTDWVDINHTWVTSTAPSMLCKAMLIHFLIKLQIQSEDYFWHKGSLYRWSDK